MVRHPGRMLPPTPEAKVIERELASTMSRDDRELPDKYKTVVYHGYVLEMSMEEQSDARTTVNSSDTVRSRIHRGKDFMERQ